MKYFVLEEVAYPFNFICISKTEKIFERKINDAFRNWKGYQAKDNELTVNDFLRKYKKVIIEITAK